jgi:VIT1/CCC1 family predicted Fe2+/Mn2+ transporter
MPQTFEPHHATASGIKLNWLRAAVLGANDGIISLSGLVIGVAGATDSRTAIVASGLAGLLAGAFSMAAGEYVSVSTQRDTERALLSLEEKELREEPEQELAELVAIYQQKGLSEKTARTVAEELTKHDVYAAHIDVELGIDPKNLTSPWQAAVASAASFIVGAVVPLVVMLASPVSVRVPLTFGAVVIALALTGLLSAVVSSTNRFNAALRVVLGGVLAMVVTYGVGILFRASGV